MRATISCTAALVSAMAVAGSGAARAKTHPQQLFVRVLDRAGNPVHDLSAGDFEVNEGGRRREVTRASLVGALRTRVAVLVDNGFLTGQTVTPLRTALESLVTSLSPDDDVALGTLSPQFRIRVKPTSDRTVLLGSIGTLFATATSGTALVDGLVEMDDRFVKPARERWPVFVIITSDSPEVSGRQIEEFNQRIHDLVQRGARVHAIVIAYSSQARGNEPEMCMALTQSTGGMYAPVATITSVPDKVKTIAATIADTKMRAGEEYVIEFGRESDAAAIDVSVPIPGVTVHVSTAP